MLDLHENPSNTAARELRDLIKQLTGNLRIELVVSPDTIDEAKRSIENAKHQLADLPVQINYSKAAFDVLNSGMAKRFLLARMEKNALLTAADWFDPYLENFVAIARSKGVELHNEKTSEYPLRQDVVDDIEFLRQLQERLPINKQRSYSQISHDMVLWHFVNDKRPAYVESPIEAKCWILTIDYKFIAFDDQKQGAAKRKVPLCIHPTTLAQLLQFWVPRTPAFEEAMLGSLRLPFLFQDFDAEGEKTSLKILNGLGRLEGGASLSSETIEHVMMNDGLRARLKPGQTADEEFTLIRDALVEETAARAKAATEKAEELNRALANQSSIAANLAEEKHAIEQSKVQIEKQKHDQGIVALRLLEEKDEALSKLGDQNDHLASSLDQERAQRVAEIKTANDELAAKQVKIDLLADEKATAQLALALQSQNHKQLELKRDVLWRYSFGLVIIIILAMLAAYLTPRALPQLARYCSNLGLQIFTACIVFPVGHLCLELFFRDPDMTVQPWLLQKLKEFRKVLWSVVVLGFLAGVAGNIYANYVQSNIDRPSSSKPLSPAK